MLANYKSLLNKISENQDIKIGFIGGSITQGCLSSVPETCYAYRVYLWFKETFPNTNFEYINAGIGGTSSHFGVARVQENLLKYEPDFVVVDFSVNDEVDEFYQETFEGLLRKIMKCNSNPAVLVLNNVFYDNGKSVQELHNIICNYYQIPVASMRDTVYNDIQKGKLKVEEITADNLHPNDYGHELVANEVIKVIEKTLNECNENNENNKEIATIKEPLTFNRYEELEFYNNKTLNPELVGFVKDNDDAEYFGNNFGYGWLGKNVNDKVVFSIEASRLDIQFRKTIKSNPPVARVIIDDNYENEIYLDSKFDETWGDSLYIEKIFDNKDKKLVKVQIEIIKSSENQIPFQLLGLIIK